jgi:hypothetical protein
MSRALSGFYCVATAIQEGFKGPRFDRGYPELYPSFRQLPRGEIVVSGYGKPPEGVRVPVGTRSQPAE